MNEEERRKHNKEILEKMKNGESLVSMKPQDIWFPPRPTIKKDKNSLSFIFNKRKNMESKTCLSIAKDYEEVKGKP